MSTSRVLSWPSRTWRLTVTAAVLAVLVVAQLDHNDDWWPLGSLSQYSSAVSPNGEVRSTYMEADDTSGETVRVPLTTQGVGVGRAEIEGQLSRILAEPALLQEIANAWENLHPDRPAYEVVRVMRSTQTLEDGVVVGEPVVEELATWTVTR